MNTLTLNERGMYNLFKTVCAENDTYKVYFECDFTKTELSKYFHIRNSTFESIINKLKDFKLIYFDIKNNKYNIYVNPKYFNINQYLPYIKKHKNKKHNDEVSVIFNIKHINNSLLQGIYRLYKDEKIVYIGQSNDINNRIEEHKRDKIFDSYDYCEINSKSDRSIYELYYIAKYKPLYNKEGKYEDDICNIFLEELIFKK